MSFIAEDLGKRKERDNSENVEEDDRKRRRGSKYEMKQLNGKRIYLDLPNISSKKLDQLRGDLELFGAEVCDFISKDVSYLITTRKDVYQNDNVATASTISTPSPANISTPSPFQTKSSASHPRSPWVQSPQETDSPASCEMKKPFPPSYNTRGKCFVQKAVATNHQGSSNLIATARKFDVKVRTLDKVLTWIESHKLKSKKHLLIPNLPTTDMKGKSHCTPSTPKVRSLKSPFIKVEDVSRMYRPQFACFSHWPFINLDTRLGISPFDISGKDSDSRHRQGIRVDKLHVKSYKKRRGYCECCQEEFDDLSSHLKSKQHVEFATDAGNYAEVDRCINEGVTFEEFLAKQRGSEDEEQTRSQTEEVVETLLLESEDDVRLIPIKISDSINHYVNGDIHTQTPQPDNTASCESHDQSKPIVANRTDNLTERKQNVMPKKLHSHDSKTSDTFHGFTRSEISRTLRELDINSPQLSQRKKLIMKTPQTSRRKLKQEPTHPQGKYLEGLTNQEQELTMFTLLTGEKNLRSCTANLLACQEKDSSPIRATRKRKHKLVSDESSASIADFKRSPTWRRPRRKQRSRNGLLTYRR